jgi:hypothetical protein
MIFCCSNEYHLKGKIKARSSCKRPLIAEKRYYEARTGNTSNTNAVMDLFQAPTYIWQFMYLEKQGFLSRWIRNPQHGGRITLESRANIIYAGGCPAIAFYCDGLQTPSTALERPKHPQRSINYACGDFALSALSRKFSLNLAANSILGQPPVTNISTWSLSQLNSSRRGCTFCY